MDNSTIQGHRYAAPMSGAFAGVSGCCGAWATGPEQIYELSEHNEGIVAAVANNDINVPRSDTYNVLKFKFDSGYLVIKQRTIP